MTRKRCAIYCRVSTKEQSNDRQEVELKEFAERSNYEVVGVYTDVISGATSKRPGRDQVIRLVKQRHIDVVLCHELTRWGRDWIDIVSTVTDVLERGVSFECLNDTSFYANTAEAQIRLGMLATVANAERKRIQERVKSGVRNAQAKGIHCGRPKGTTGKLYGQNYAPLRGRIKNLRRNGVSIRQIAKQCGCSTTTVQAILKA